MADIQDLGKAILKTYSALTSVRAPLDAGWHDAYRYSYPYRGQHFTNKSIDGVTAAANAKAEAAVLFDSTATDGVRLLASSVMSALTPPSSQWFSLTVQNMADDAIPRDAKEWLDNAAARIFDNIHASNYDSQALEFFIDVMIGGMCGLYAEKRDGKYFFENWPLHSLYCQDTLGNGIIDTIYRLCRFTAAEATTRFKTVPDHITAEYAKDPYSSKQFDFIHTIRPRLQGTKQKRGKLAKQMPWESIYVCHKTGTVVSESGFAELPVIVPRWMRIPETDYAYGPMQDALPDVKTLNKVREFMLQNCEMHIAGMYVAKDDGVMNPATVKIGPRRILMTADVGNIKPLAAGGDIDFAIAEIQHLQAQVRRTLLADQLGPSDKANMTATEIQTRTNLIRQVLGPIFGRLQAEYLVPLIARCFGLALREGDLPPPPQSLQGLLFNVTSRSPLAKAQKTQELSAIDQFEQRLANKAQFNPAIFDLYNFDKSVEMVADLLGLDVKLLNDPMTIKKIRDGRAAQQAQAQAAAQAQQAQAQGGPAEATEPGEMAAA